MLSVFWGDFSASAVAGLGVCCACFFLGWSEDSDSERRQSGRKGGKPMVESPQRTVLAQNAIIGTGINKRTHVRIDPKQLETRAAAAVLIQLSKM